MEARELLRRQREASGLTQEQLAARVGKTLGAVSGWESGSYRPRRLVVEQLDLVLGSNGELLDAFYPTTSPLDVLRADHDALVREVADLRLTVEKLLASQVAAAKRRT